MWPGCESARVYRKIKQRWTDTPDLLHYAHPSNLSACCVIRRLVSLLRMCGWTIWPKVLSPRATEPTVAQHGIVSRTQPTASQHKLCPEHSPLPHDTNSAQNTAHFLPTQTLPRTQPTVSRHKLCPEHSPLLHDRNSVQNTQPCAVPHKLCPEQSTLTLKATYFLSA